MPRNFVAFLKKKSDPSAYFKVYEEYMKTLRAWFVAYGIGGPALFITQTHLTDPLICSGQATCIAILFLGGMAIQIGIAALNKWINWILYYGEEHSDFQESCVYKLSHRVSSWFWLDILADIFSIILFSWGTIKVLSILAKPMSVCEISSLKVMHLCSFPL